MPFSYCQKILKTAEKAKWRGWNNSYMNHEEKFDSGTENLRNMYESYPLYSALSLFNTEIPGNAEWEEEWRFENSICSKTVTK